MYEVKRERLRCMQAWIKYYDDGTEILQSYSTDVVKRTPEGKLVRLWGSNSVSTSKQVSIWCGVPFRSIPFADGTLEIIEREKYYNGKMISTYSLEPISDCRSKRYNENFPENAGKRIIDSIESGNIKSVICNFNTLGVKVAKQHFNQKTEQHCQVRQLLKILSQYARGQVNRSCPILHLYMTSGKSFREYWDKVKNQFPLVLTKDNELDN